MLLSINNTNQKVHKKLNVKNRIVEVEVKKQIYLYAHNGKGFDSFVIMNDPYLKEIEGIKFSKITKNTSGLLNLSIEMSNVVVNLRCTLAHHAGSLKTLCENFKVSESIKKDGFNILQMNETNYQNEQLKQECIYYL